MPDALAVKYIHNAMRGAPVLNGQNGTLIGLLDALLLNGWGAATAASVTVADGVATATFGSSTPWEVGAVIEVSGATPAGLNGQSRVLSAADASMTFATSAPNGAATGTISIKYAAAGWSKPFTGSNLAAYRSQDLLSPRHYLRVRDNYGKYATVSGFEAMTAISTGTGRFSRSASLDHNGSTWHKSTQANATAVPYLVAADSRAIIVAIAEGVPDSANYHAAGVYGFGDCLPLAPSGDAWCTFLASVAYDAGSMGEGSLSHASGPGASYGGIVMPRKADGTGGVQAVGAMPVSGGYGTISGGDGSFGPAPSAVTGGVLCSRMRMCLADYTSRAMAPGVLFIPQAVPAGMFLPGDVQPGSDEFAGRRLRLVSVGDYYYQPSGFAVIDLTGPWR